MLKITKRAMLIAFLASTALTSCEKNEKEQTNEEAAPVGPEAIRLQKLKRFLTIAFKASETDIVFNDIDGKILIKGTEFTKQEIEHLYDTANEYKLVYENEIFYEKNCINSFKYLFVDWEI